ncbi:hypothetical protein FB45DRAFT_862108 [Roridomyces roridus]|uniref:Uncharacterized protein n=1 Tax=Roridomyces roridus TaxID=1738132 RepID=A0AAD7FXT1_9AGAR|nr:hypothetical protein FB45DRAFT_862108 [Roridomyces roridus]
MANTAFDDRIPTRVAILIAGGWTSIVLLRPFRKNRKCPANTRNPLVRTQFIDRAGARAARRVGNTNLPTMQSTIRNKAVVPTADGAGLRYALTSEDTTRFYCGVLHGNLCGKET